MSKNLKSLLKKVKPEVLEEAKEKAKQILMEMERA